MIDPSLTISITRLLLPGSLAPLQFAATPADETLGIFNYQPPSAIARNGYAPANRFRDGAELTSSAWEKTNLGLDWMADEASSETEIQAAYAEVLAAIGQFTFEVTTQVSGAPAQVWRADRGSMSPAPRTYLDLANLCPVYPVTIPVHPIPGAP